MFCSGLARWPLLAHDASLKFRWGLVPLHACGSDTGTELRSQIHTDITERMTNGWEIGYQAKVGASKTTILQWL